MKKENGEGAGSHVPSMPHLREMGERELGNETGPEKRKERGTGPRKEKKRKEKEGKKE